jgi:hypothetical protein
MGCKTSKVHVEVYRVGMDLTTYYDLRVFPKMRTMLFSVNSEWQPQQTADVACRVFSRSSGGGGAGDGRGGGVKCR